MAVFNPWARHYQSGWENRAANHELPMWARVVCYAYGRHDANGHARFERGDLVQLLGKPPKDGAPFKPAPRQSMHDAIATAVRFGWLDEGSFAECLVVPGHEITGGLGKADAECPLLAKHIGQRAKLAAKTA
jgi:hypothetical protein